MIFALKYLSFSDFVGITAVEMVVEQNTNVNAIEILIKRKTEKMRLSKHGFYAFSNKWYEIAIFFFQKKFNNNTLYYCQLLNTYLVHFHSCKTGFV
jgi:hypothetical protein